MVAFLGVYRSGAKTFRLFILILLAARAEYKPGEDRLEEVSRVWGPTLGGLWVVIYKARWGL
jgi:hypothetical protein